MMDEQKDGNVVWAGRTTCACGPDCTCGCGCGRGYGYGGYCGYGYHRVGRAVWWIVGIIVLFVVFFLGVALGRFSDRLRAMYGGYYYRAYPMMQDGGGYYYGGGSAVSPASPAVPFNGNVTGTPPGTQ